MSWLLFLSLLAFLAQAPALILTILLAIPLVFLSARLPLRGLAGLRLALSTAVLLALLQILFVNEGEVFLQAGRFAITDTGLYAAVRIGGRFLAVLLISYAFVLSTSANDLSYVLMQIGLPYRYGFALVTALRLVPIFQREADLVYKAQLARGCRYDQFRLRNLLDLMRQYLFPLLVSTLGKVDALAVSMESRSFGLHPTRTYVHLLPFHRRDGLAALILTAVAATYILIGPQ